MKKTRTGGYLRQLLHLIGKFIEDKQNGKRFTITGWKKLRTIRNTRRTKHSHSNTKHFQYLLPYTT